ncbi:MAG: serine hydrolase domain-containing protein [Candidatus Baltobacteraceae bacterium]
MKFAIALAAVAMGASGSSAVTTAATEVATSALARQRIPGMAVAVVRNGQLVLDKAYGVREIAHRKPVGPETIFEIGSITKQFTAAAVLQLKERGELRLSDRLGQYVPEYPRGRDITIEQLLHQTSGIPDHINDPPNAVTIITTRPGSLTAALALIKSMPLHFRPGTQWEYSNTNYLLLSAIVERVSKMPFAEYVSKNIFGPAHMTRSAFLKDEPCLANMAAGYLITPSGKLDRAGHIGYGWSGGAGSIVSTAGDLARWDIAYFSGRIISAADVKLATTPAHINGKSTNYGFGWETDASDGLPTISHGGGMLGFTSTNDVFPTLGLSIVVLTNNGNASPDAVAKGIVAQLDPEFAAKQNAAVSGEDPALTARIRTVWVQLHQGTLDRSLLTESFSQNLTPQVLRFMHAHFAGVGPPLRWIYKGKQAETNGNVTYTYRVLFKDGFALAITASVAPNGKIAYCDSQYA